MDLSSDIIWKLVLSVFIGGIIGAEREYRSKSAGFRTLTLICLGATLFTIFSIAIGGPDNKDRIASNIITGIGFVGAGVIFKGDIGVNGITTAAMIWVTAALGMGIGAGYEWISIFGSALILLMLLIYGQVEQLIDQTHQIRNYRIVSEYKEGIMQHFETLFKEHKLSYKRSRQMKSEKLFTGEWIVRGSEKKHRKLVHHILRDDSIKAFEF